VLHLSCTALFLVILGLGNSNRRGGSAVQSDEPDLAMVHPAARYGTEYMHMPATGFATRPSNPY